LNMNAADAGSARELASALLKSGEFAQARVTLAPFAGSAALPEEHQLLARADEGSGLFRQAEQEYRMAERDKPSEENVFGVGYELMLEGSTADAEAAFKAGVEQYPRSMPMRVGAATAEFLAGDVSMAVHSLLNATDISPDDLRAYALLVKIAGVPPGENERVVQSFERLLKREPDSAEANYLYAVALSRKSDVAVGRVEMLLKRAIELDPSLAGAYLKLANLFVARGDYQAAIPEYEAAVRLDPSLLDARYRLALAYRRTGHVDQSGREMRLFLLSKERGDGKGQGDAGDVMDLAQFVSAVETPEQKLRLARPCVP
jgi:tetratricopeptide (TPR) repeat protein